ncbi:MAG: N-acetylneuraminate synthase family protein [Spirochaetales bacterium]|nr:N-acetylneuraminate synthase family protein [Spirochaetales bacterium]
MNPIIVAELGTAHGGSLNKAKELIGEAARAGADYAKFQMVFAGDIIHPLTGNVPLPGGDTPLFDVFTSLEKEKDFYEKLREICRREGIGYLPTPFGPRSWKLIQEMGTEGIKIASPELNHLPLLRDAAHWKQEKEDHFVILSSGVSHLGDIEEALTCFPNRENLTLLHCITAYPAPAEEYNLALIPLYKALFGCASGVSDHSTDPLLVPLTATALGASLIEKHFCLSHSDGGLDDPIALEAGDFAHMVSEVRERAVLSQETQQEMLRREHGSEIISRIIGDGRKRLAEAEKGNYGRTNRSLHALTDLPADTILTKDNTALLRTEKILRPGLSPREADRVLGKKLTRSVPSGQGITWEDLLTE